MPRRSRCPASSRVFEALARQAREEHWGYEEFLHEALSAEQTSRRDSAVRHRLREARFPEMKTLDTFDFVATDGTVHAAQLAELARGEWIGRADNIIFAGPIGTGKVRTPGHRARRRSSQATKASALHPSRRCRPHASGGS